MTRAFCLTAAERQTLEELRDHAPKPYLRERAAALLKVDAGLPPARVARAGLLRPRKPDTVYAWLDRSTQDVLACLYIRSGRGRKPAFSPAACHGAGRRGGTPGPRAAVTAPMRAGAEPLDAGRPAPRL